MIDGIQKTGDLTKSLSWLEENGPKFFKAALYAGAAVLKKTTKNNLSSALPAATHHNPRYSDTLMDAVRNSKTEGDVITVHILGTRQSTSGTYRTRFFEKGTKRRYQKSYRGIKLKKKRYLGKLEPLNFFSSAISSSQGDIAQAMTNVMDNFMRIASTK